VDGTVQLSAVWRSAVDGGRIAYPATYAGHLSASASTLSGTIFTIDGKTEPQLRYRSLAVTRLRASLLAGADRLKLSLGDK